LNVELDRFFDGGSPRRPPDVRLDLADPVPVVAVLDLVDGDGASLRFVVAGKLDAMGQHRRAILRPVFITSGHARG
jgi:hypothetical protein